MFFVGIGWDYLGFISIKCIFKIIVIFVLAIMIYLGISNASIKRQEFFSKGKLYYGFQKHYKKQWYLIDKCAMTGFIAKNNSFFFSYKSFNTKMAQLGQYLEFYVNDVLIEKLPLNSISERIIYYDISRFSGNKVKIDFKINRTYIPLKEKWFIDSRKYGALMTKPKQINDSLAEIRERVKCDQRIRLITDFDF